MEDRKKEESKKKYAEGFELLQKRDYKYAKKAFEDAIIADPASAEAYSGKANALFGMQEVEKGFKAIEKALELAPDNVGIIDMYGAYLYNFGKFSDALGVVERLISMDPGNPDYWHKKGDVHAGMEDNELAVEAYDKALAIDPTDVEVLRDKGILLEQMQKFEGALDAFKQAAKLVPDEPYFYNCQGQLFGRLGRYEEALLAFSLTLKVAPDDEYAINGMAASLTKLGKMDEALQMFEEMVARNPENAFSWDGKAYVLKAMGRLEESEKASEHAKRLFRKQEESTPGMFGNA